MGLGMLGVRGGLKQTHILEESSPCYSSGCQNVIACLASGFRACRTLSHVKDRFLCGTLIVRRSRAQTVISLNKGTPTDPKI